jgi:hypothetical protein
VKSNKRTRAGEKLPACKPSKHVNRCMRHMKSNDLTPSCPISYYCAVKYQDAELVTTYMTREFIAAREEKKFMCGPSIWQEMSHSSLYFQNVISTFLNLARGVTYVSLLLKCYFWVPKLGFGCHPGPNGSKPATIADMARSYMWGPHVSGLYFYFGGTVAMISRIFQKLYIFRTISYEDDFYIKIIALDEIYDFVVLSFLI